MAKRVLKIFKYMLLTFLFVVLLTAGYFGYLQVVGNFHVVTKSQLYRSAQLSEDEWVYFIKKYHIRSILNLRGVDGNAKWYKIEMAVSKKFYIKHYNYGISAVHIVTIPQMKIIIHILETSPKPLLIHCQSGADRSGLVASLWELVIMHKSPEKAVSQLSLIYGHFPYLGSKTVAMNESFWDFVRYYEREHRLSNKASSLLKLSHSH